jgi:chromosome segregation ATPase
MVNVLNELFGLHDTDLINPIGFDFGHVLYHGKNSPLNESNERVPSTQNKLEGNREMANKINELYNELNQKDKDLNETRETLKRTRYSIRDFRKRAEDAELNAARKEKSYNELSLMFTKLVDYNNELKKENENLKRRVDSLLEKIDAYENGTLHGTRKLSINDNGEIYNDHAYNVDDIDIPLVAAEEIIKRIQGK